MCVDMMAGAAVTSTAHPPPSDKHPLESLIDGLNSLQPQRRRPRTVVQNVTRSPPRNDGFEFFERTPPPRDWCQEVSGFTRCDVRLRDSPPHHLFIVKLKGLCSRIIHLRTDSTDPYAGEGAVWGPSQRHGLHCPYWSLSSQHSPRVAARA